MGNSGFWGQGSEQDRGCGSSLPHAHGRLTKATENRSPELPAKMSMCEAHACGSQSRVSAVLTCACAYACLCVQSCTYVMLHAHMHCHGNSTVSSLHPSHAH